MAIAGVLAAFAAVGGAGAKGDPSDSAVFSTPGDELPVQSAAQPAPPQPPAPPPPATVIPPPEPAPPEASDEVGSETATAQPKPSAAPPKPAEPAKRPRYAVAIMQALDKVTAETIRFEAPIDTPIRYKTLIFTVHACETTAPDEPRTDAAANVEIDSQPLPAPGHGPLPARRVFLGWMFASSPGLDLFQHPVYDAWLVACKTALPST